MHLEFGCVDTYDLPTATGGMDLYPGANLLTEGAPATALASLSRQGVGVLAYRDLAQPFENRSSSPCRQGNRTKCIDAVAEMFRTEEVDELGVPWERWSGIALDEWTTANSSNWAPTDPWGAPNALANLAAGCREGRGWRPAIPPALPLPGMHPWRSCGAPCSGTLGTVQLDTQSL